VTRPTRRTLLRAGTAGLVAGVAGCRGLPSTGPGNWTYDPGTPAGRIGTPAVGDGVVFAGAEDKAVHAVDADSGERVWRYETGGACDRPVAVGPDGTTVYAESRDGTLYALRDGERRWQFETHRVGDPPVLADGTVYLPDRTYVDGRDRGRLHAFAAADGTRQWTFRAQREFLSLSAVVDDAIVCQGRGTGPGAGEDDRESQLHVLAAADGTRRWASDPDEAFVADADGAVVAALVRRHEVSDEGRDVATDELRVFDIDSGMRKWSRPVETRANRAIRVAGGIVYYGTDGGVVARDAASGERRWHVANDDGRRRASFAVAGGDDGAGDVAGAGETVFLTTRDDVERSSVLAVDAADGSTRWETAVGGDRGFERVAVTGDAVYASRYRSSSWELTVLDAGSGEKRTTYALEGGGEWTATPDGVYVGTEDGSIVAFG